jgi:hypothetical protein
MKLVIFGDSFANYNHCPTPELNWANQLSNVLGLPLINYAISGSGLNYSFIQLVNYFNSKDYHPEDILIFVNTEDRRIFSKDMTDPTLGGFFNFTPSMREHNKEWFLKNFEHALWAVENIYHPSINFEQLKVFSFLKAWAKAHPSNKVIILRGVGVPSGEWGDREPLIRETILPDENFFPLLNPTLGHITVNEFSDPSLYNKLLNHWISGVDPRVNHLSKVNRDILVQMLGKIIKKKDINLWNNASFVKDIYKDINDIKNSPKDYF